MSKLNRVYQNSTELMNLNGVPFYMNDFVDACLYGRLNLFLQGDTGSGKTQLAKDTMNYFPNKSMFVLGRNDMDTRELFQQINLEKLKTGSSSQELKELTDKINTKLFVVDELPNCVPAVRAQLFNLFDGFIELNGQTYPIGEGYSVGIATGNLGQKFTESSNDLGRALKDRMHVTIDTDYFKPTSWDTFNILSNNTNPRVDFTQKSGNGDLEEKILTAHDEVTKKEIPFEKLLIANYLIHGLDYVNLNGRETTKTKLKDAWPNAITNVGSDESLILPVSPRAAKSILRLSQAFDYIAKEKDISDKDIDNSNFDSMAQAFKFVGAYSGILNDRAVREKYGNDKYSALDAVISTTKTQYESQLNNISAGLNMVRDGKKYQKVLDKFNGRWNFMRNFLERTMEENSKDKK
jgi:MoxR-like ATPase